MPAMNTIAARSKRSWRPDYERVDDALRFLEQRRGRPVSLGEVAAAVGLSPFHFQRVFTRWTGISPKRFAQYLTLDDARALLRTDASLLEAACELGLSGPSRLHDLFVTFEAATPGEYKAGGAGLTIEIGEHETPFGTCLLGLSPRGVCWLSFGESRHEGTQTRRHGGSLPEELADLRRAWPAAEIVANPAATGRVVDQIFGNHRGRATVRVLAGGTNFQIKVWEALLRIPPGGLATYSDIAVEIGMPGAARAVGNACGTNRIAWLIPCHRVIRSMGIIGNYGGGVPRKQAMIAWEAARYADLDERRAASE